jgi:hypothetical protein
VDRQLRRCAVRVVYTGTAAFVIDHIRPYLDWGRSKQDWTYTAFIDRASANRVSIQIAYSTAGSFVIHRIVPDIQRKRHLPTG